MGLFGSLETMTLEELLRWVQAGAKSGTLEVERDKIRKRIMFEGGHVVACSSDDPATLIGQFLLSRGAITEGMLRDALARQQHTPKNLGAILTEMGAITHEDNARFVEAKIEETIYGMFDWTDAVFRFDANAAVDPHAVDVDLDVQTILDRGRQRHHELQQSQEVLDDPCIVLFRTEGVEPPDVSGNRAAALILDLIDGKRSVADILLHSRAPEFLVNKFLTALLKGGVVEIAGVRSRTRQDAVEEVPVIEAEPEADIELPIAEEQPHPVELTGESTIELPVVDEQPGPVPEPAARPAEDPLEAHGVECPDWSFKGQDDSQTVREPEVEAVATPEPEPPTPVSAPAVKNDVNVAMQLMSSGQPEAALELLNAMLAEFPSDGALRHLVDNAENEFRTAMIAGELALTRVPIAVPSVEAQLTPEETFLQGLIDGDNDVRAILWLAPLREVDALKTLRGMLRKGLIEVREKAVA